MKEIITTCMKTIPGIPLQNNSRNFPPMRLKLKSWPWDLISRVSTGSTIYILTKGIQYAYICANDLKKKANLGFSYSENIWLDFLRPKRIFSTRIFSSCKHNTYFRLRNFTQI